MTEEEVMVKKDYVENIIAENKELTGACKEYEALIDAYKKAQHDSKYTTELRYRDGIIEGLKFAIRCNGVSGSEVR